MRSFQYRKSDYSIVVGWFQAIDEFPAKFNIHLADLVSDMQKSNETVNTILLNDNIIIQLMWYYLKPHVTCEWEDFLKQVEATEVHKFRESFWEAVLDFSGPLKTPILTQLWKEVKKELREVNLEELASKYSQEASTQTP
jgi:hypothetical protein